jgi:hypothetical protein
VAVSTRDAEASSPDDDTPLGDRLRGMVRISTRIPSNSSLPTVSFSMPERNSQQTRSVVPLSLDVLVD